jgi:HEAT repeat protein
MKRRTQRIVGVGGICALIVLVVFGVVRYAHQEPLTPDPVRPGLQAAVAGAKTGNRGVLDSVIEQVNRRDLKISEALLPDFASFLRDSDPQVQLLGATGLFVLSSPKSKGPLTKYLKSVDTSQFRAKPENRNTPATEMQTKRFLWAWQAVGLAAAALGNVGDESSIPALEAVKDCPPFEFWDPVSGALAKLYAAKELRTGARPSANMRDVARAEEGIRQIRDPKEVQHLMALVRAKKSTAALEALADMNSPEVASFLASVVSDTSYPDGFRCVAALSAGKTHANNVEKPLLDLANDPNLTRRAYALTSLALYNPEKYFPRVCDAIMDVQEAQWLRGELLLRAYNHLPRELLRGQREQLYRCLQAKDRNDRADDEVRVKTWMLIDEFLGEEPPIVLSSKSSLYVHGMRSMIENRLSFQLHKSSAQAEADEKFHQLVSFSPESPQMPPNGPRVMNGER